MRQENYPFYEFDKEISKTIENEDNKIQLDKTNARKFNASMKKIISDHLGFKVSVEIINSYKFPNCYVRLHSGQNEFSNDFRLLCFDCFGNDRKGLLNDNNVSYGNIQSKSISGKVFQWENLISNL
jgi:hypothetical protein